MSKQFVKDCLWMVMVTCGIGSGCLFVSNYKAEAAMAFGGVIVVGIPISLLEVRLEKEEEVRRKRQMPCPGVLGKSRDCNER